MSTSVISIAALTLALAGAGGLAAQTSKTEPTPLQTLRAQLRDGDSRAQWRALRGLVRMGESAVPTLIALLAEVDIGGKPRASARIAAKALQQLGAHAVTALPTAMKLLEEGSPAQALLAIELIGIVGPHDSERTEDYKEKVRQRSTRHRIAARTGKARASGIPHQAAVGCLIRLSEAHPSGIDALVNHLESDSSVQIEMALERMGGFDPQQLQPARSAIRTALLRTPVQMTSFKLGGRTWGMAGSYSGDAGETRQKAAQLLARLGSDPDTDDAERQAIHVALMAHGDPAVRQRHALSLGGLGTQVGKAGVEALVKATADRDKLVAWDAITALGMLGRTAEPALPRLRQLAAGADKAKAARANAAIRAIER